MSRARACKIGVSHAKIDGRFGSHPSVLRLSDSAFRALLRLASTSASWDYCGAIPEDLILGIIDANTKKAKRILVELTTGRAPLLYRAGADYWIDAAVLPFGRDGEAWDQSESGKVLARDGHACRYCGTHLAPEEITYDHIFPRSRGGGDKPSNLVVCCLSCNLRKGDKTPEEAGMALRPLIEA